MAQSALDGKSKTTDSRKEDEPPFSIRILYKVILPLVVVLAIWQTITIIIPNLTSIVDDPTGNHVVIAYWQYGDGIIYYTANTNGTVMDSGGTPKDLQIRDIINLPRGNSNSIKIGLDPGTQGLNASHIVNVDRIAMVDSDKEILNVNVIVWKRCLDITC